VTTPVLAGARRLAGKHAIVPGGTRGIGAAIARELLAQGARVTILGRNPQSLEKALVPFVDSGEMVRVIADVVDSRAVAKAFASASEHFGAIQILVNSAGQASSAPFLKTDPQLWRRMLDVNVEGAVHCMQAALPGMLEAGWGRIVTIASTAGLIGYAYVSAYCASKHALIGLTRALALEVATKGVTVNAVCPGFTETEMLEATIANITAKTGRTAESARGDLTARNPQKRLVQPEEVANAVCWLCSPGSESITGQAIAVAGGEVM
jgi:NAD(P)-dependent dehydrogenase (short-subunit alcohol dehydrogenase family)